MKISVGIPRALLYYNYYPLWHHFFKNLGAEVVLSSKTTKKILDQGVQQAVDEACLPVKLYYGHVMDLAGKVDYLFLPRMVSVEKKAYICPKFLGLPDMIRNNVPGLPKLIEVCVNMNRRESNLWKAVYETGKFFTNNPAKIWWAFRKGLKAQQEYEKILQTGTLPHEALEAMEKGNLPGALSDSAAVDIMQAAHNSQGMNSKVVEENDKPFTIALIGHGYNIYDSHISMNIIGKLREMGARVVTADNLSHALLENEASILPKKLFWTLGKRMMGASFHYFNHPEVDGIIHIAAFGCGPDSFTGELIEREARRRRTKPFMALTIDEHTGEAGIVTRLEAFLDMIRWRAAHESNLSAHG